MKQLLAIICAIIVLYSCMKLSQPSDLTFITYEGWIGTNDNSTLVSYDNNLIICGNTNDGICILKVSKSGGLIWRKDYSIGFECRISAIAENDNHELFVCGEYKDVVYHDHDLILIKTTSSGDTIWTRFYGGPGHDEGRQIIKTSDNKLLICGLSQPENLADGNIYLVKVDSNGDTIWTNTYPDPVQEIPYHLLETENGEYLVTGTNEDVGTGRELYFLKIDQNGNKLWAKKFGYPPSRWGYCTIELSNSDLLTCGYKVGQVMLMKTDNIGNIIWEKEYGNTTFSERAFSMKQNIDGTFTMTGYTYNAKNPQDDIILLKVDQNGNQVWIKRFGDSTIDERGVNLIKNYNDDNVITGKRIRFKNDRVDIRNIILTRLDSNGDFK